ncbi:MAG: hypothetical protein Tsb0013_17260 [Phycisphaerales bacterium]
MPEREVFAPPRAELPSTLPDGTVALEVLSWGTLAPELGRDLTRLSRPIDGEMSSVASSLRAQGLRLVRLDASDVGALFELAPPAGAVRRRIILPGVRFEEVADGATLEATGAVETPLGVRRVGPGTARLSVRAWGTPAGDGSVRVRADVVGVVGTTRSDERRELLSGTRQEPLSGQPVPGLSAHLVSRTDEAWALVAASPDEDWSRMEGMEPAPANAPVDPAMDGEAVRPVGPRVEALRTSGELLFMRAPSSLTLRTDDEDARLVVLLVARAPGRFTLFPERASDQ